MDGPSEIRKESFAEKVRSGGGGRFDPLLEEKGGWIAGEAHRQDAEMAEAVIEELAEAINQTNEGMPNPFRGQNGETLPPNTERCFSGFLVRSDAIKFRVNPEKLLARIAMLKDQLLIGKFVGPKPNPQAMKLWIQTLNNELRGSTVEFCRNVGKGFFIMSGDDKDALNNALMLSPFKSKWGTCLIQSWVPGFNPENPSNLAFPTWVSLRNMPFEHQDQAMAIAETLGEVIGFDTSNDTAKDPRFCINLEISKGWVTSIDLEVEGEILPTQRIMVDYDKLPIRCRSCLSWKHKASECGVFQKRPMRGRPTYARNTHYHEKGKNPAVDEDGFQQVINKKNTRRNVFEKGGTMGGNRQTTIGHTGEYSRAREETHAADMGLESTADPYGGQGTTEPNNMPIETPALTSDHQRGETTPNPAGNYELLGRRDPGLDEETNTNLEGGRGDPASTMLWSPEKICGSKRTLAERSATDDEAEASTEETSDEEGDEYDESEDSEEEETDDLGHLSNSVAMALDTDEGRLAIEGLQPAEGGYLGRQHQAKLRPEVQGATKTGANDSASLNQGMLETNQNPQATGKQQGHKARSIAAAFNPGTLDTNQNPQATGTQQGHKARDTAAARADPRRESRPTRQGSKDELYAQPEREEPSDKTGADPEAAYGHSGDTSPSRTEHGLAHAGPEQGRHERAERVAGSANTPTTMAAASRAEPEMRLAEATVPQALGMSSPKDPGIASETVKAHNDYERAWTSKNAELHRERDLVVVESSYPEADITLLPNRGQSSVISETQLQTYIKNKGSVYSEILASIGLDSPTSSSETRSEGGIPRNGHEDQSISTPIRNSASSLVALGKHVLTPRQGRSWTYGNKSPLGG